MSESTSSFEEAPDSPPKKRKLDEELHGGEEKLLLGGKQQDPESALNDDDFDTDTTEDDPEPPTKIEEKNEKIEEKNEKTEGPSENVSIDLTNDLNKKRLEAEMKQQKLEENLEKHKVSTTCNCKFKKCDEKISDERRKNLNAQYWAMSNAERQIFISSNIFAFDVNRRRVDYESNRTKSMKYFLKDDTGVKQEVCKTFFLTTLGYDRKNDKIITTVVSKMETPGVYNASDNRGKHPKKMTDRDALKVHVKSFMPTIPNFKTEHTLNKKFLPNDLTIQAMHLDFVDMYPDVKCSYELYRRYVSDDLNMAFGPAGSEECDACESFRLHNPEHNADDLCSFCKNCNEWVKHRNKATEARFRLRNDAENPVPNTFYVAADHENFFTVPRIDRFHKAVFSNRIIVLKESFVPLEKRAKKNPVICLWHEAISGRRKEDILSTIHAYLLHMRDEQNVVMWVDNRASQYKNWTIFSYLTYIVNSNQIAADSITLRYYEPCQTTMAAENLHHQIEVSLKRQRNVYDFADFVKCVQAANSGKLDVIEMKAEDFFLWPDNSSPEKINSQKPRPYVKDFVEVVAERGEYTLKYKTEFSGYSQTFTFLQDEAIKESKKPPAIETARGLDEKRKESIINDLLKLVPENRQTFWKNLPVNNKAADLRFVYDDD